MIQYYWVDRKTICWSYGMSKKWTWKLSFFGPFSFHSNSYACWPYDFFFASQANSKTLLECCAAVYILTNIHYIYGCRR